MEFRFDDGDLQRLYTDLGFKKGFSEGIVRAFRRVMQVIAAAPDERTFRGLRSLNFERLKGDRKHQHSMRLNKQWRLVVEFEGKGSNKVVVVKSIEDYH